VGSQLQLQFQTKKKCEQKKKKKKILFGTPPTQRNNSFYNYFELNQVYQREL